MRDYDNTLELDILSIKMDRNGKLTLIMKDEVEIIEDLTDLLVKIMVEDDTGRNLQDLDNVALMDKPFIELKIIPGIDSDIGFLGFNYTANMTDHQ